jgi:hypothetical protein
VPTYIKTADAEAETMLGWRGTFLLKKPHTFFYLIIDYLDLLRVHTVIAGSWYMLIRKRPLVYI